MFYELNYKTGKIEEKEGDALGGRFKFMNGKFVRVGDARGGILNYGGSDTIEGFQSMADGKIYDSKSAYYQSLKDKGLECVGNEKQSIPEPTYKPLEQDVKEAYEKVMVV